MWGQLQEPGRVKQIDRLEESDTLCRFQRAAFDILNKKDCPSELSADWHNKTTRCPHEWVRRNDTVSRQQAMCTVHHVHQRDVWLPHCRTVQLDQSSRTRSESCCVFPNDAVDTVSCPTNATPPEITQPALQELAGVPALCYETYVMAISPCIQYELYCTSPT